jgi:hypothetical protein
VAYGVRVEGTSSENQFKRPYENQGLESAKELSWSLGLLPPNTVIIKLKKLKKQLWKKSVI